MPEGLAITDDEREEVYRIIEETTGYPYPQEVVYALGDAGFPITTWRVLIEVVYD